MRKMRATSILQTVTNALLLGEASAAGVTGKAFGFASGTTGGGSATPAAPSYLAQYVFSTESF